MRSPLFAVIAIDRLKRRYFCPLGEELRSRRADEAAAVGATHSKAAQTEVFQHGSGQTQMVPGGTVVARPCLCIALASGVRSAGEHKRPLVRRNLQQSFIRGARIFHAVNIVDLKMAGTAPLETGLVNLVTDVTRNRLVRRAEDRRLIHVVPEPGDTIRDKS